MGWVSGWANAPAPVWPSLGLFAAPVAPCCLMINNAETALAVKWEGVVREMGTSRLEKTARGEKKHCFCAANALKVTVRKHKQAEEGKPEGGETGGGDADAARNSRKGCKWNGTDKTHRWTCLQPTCPVFIPSAAAASFLSRVSVTQRCHSPNLGGRVEGFLAPASCSWHGNARE